MILSIGSSTGGMNPISVVNCTELWQCLNYYTGVLCYIHRLICAEPSSIARKFTVHVFMQMYIDKDISTYERPIAVLNKTCKKYNLMDIEYNELFFSATPMSSTRWKKCVYNSVSQQHIARWNICLTNV